MMHILSITINTLAPAQKRILRQYTVSLTAANGRDTLCAVGRGVLIALETPSVASVVTPVVALRSISVHTEHTAVCVCVRGEKGMERRRERGVAISAGVDGEGRINWQLNSYTVDLIPHLEL